MTNVVLERIANAVGQRYTGEGMPAAKQQVKNQDCQAEVVMVRRAMRGRKAFERLKLGRCVVRHTHFTEVRSPAGTGLVRVAIDQHDATVSTGESISLVYVTEDVAMVMQNRKGRRQVPGHKNQKIPAPVWMLLLAVRWAVNFMEGSQA